MATPGERLCKWGAAWPTSQQVGSSWTGMLSLPCRVNPLFGSGVLLRCRQRRRLHGSAPGGQQSVQAAFSSSSTNLLELHDVRVVKALVIQDLPFHILGNLQRSRLLLGTLPDSSPLDMLQGRLQGLAAHLVASLNELDCDLGIGVCVQCQLHEAKRPLIQVSQLHGDG